MTVTLSLSLSPAPAAVAAADAATRTLTGLVCPYGLPGSTSAGPLTVTAGALTWPADLRAVKLLRDHDRSRPVGYALAATDSPEGLSMTFRMAATPDGQAALIEATEGVRDAFSVELADATIDGDTITAGTLAAVALVAVPAYSTARVATIAAAARHDQDDADEQDDDRGDADEQDDDQDESDDESDDDERDPGPVPPDPDPVTTTPPPPPPPPAPAEQDPAMPSATIPTGSRPPVTAAAPAPVIASVSDFARVAALIRANPHDPAVSAALVDITRTAQVATDRVGWLGELWNQVRYQRQIIPQLATGPLTSYQYVGWRWKVAPTGGAYAGDKAAIPSNPAETEPVNLGASRWAGGNDVDRKFIDFNDTEFLESYSREMVDDYARFTDGAALDFCVDNAETLTAPDVSSAIVTGIFGVGRTNLQPSWLKISADLVEEAAALPAMQVPPLVSAMLGTLTMGDLLGLSHRNMPPRTVLIGAKAAVEYRELGGGSPVRVDAVDLARGGFDRAFFGYYSLFMARPGGVVAVTVDAGGGTAVAAARTTKATTASK